MLGQQHIVKLDITCIRPNPSQPRRTFTAQDLRELADSIASNGLLQPLVVRRVQSGYELIAGERRLRACKFIGMREVPVLITSCTDRESAIFALTENLQRADLNMFEEADGIRRLIEEWNITQEECATRLGRSQSAVANKLRLLKLPGRVRETILENRLTERHARALLRLSEPEQQAQVLETVLKKKLNVQQTDALISKLLEAEPKQHQHRLPIFKDVRIFGNTIQHAVTTLRSTGVPAETFHTETEEYLEWVVRIPKSASPGRKPA
ncbi:MULTISPECIES: ParB/RepB/Spo0J family partition protein [Caproicibacterium]|uniref:ParB/RepB/Spo0J family partition protein n=1 Tax=Caproicibacterium argilliputei TaxID=3030016 RepID=A0AA97DAX5_9FIRM|nr:ParB/RepB/Spo0J family partition protein [Caproicibacterium argilliputei]WOC32275.1 ParB/RepB/Spo0J family partition protein [Caproicibacterium argilliputei]